MAWVAWLAGACAGATPAPTAPEASSDPRRIVTAWSQVARFNCGAPCQSDVDCGEGSVCDASESCGCCVAAPPPTPPSSTLRNYRFTSCVDGACEAPAYCAMNADGTSCASAFESEVVIWMTTFAPTSDRPLEEARRELCILAQPEQHCLWELRLEDGDHTIDGPLPVRHSGYECGGRTCNGQPAYRVSPELGSRHVARLVWSDCAARP
jgi:hypothetical protein